MLIKPTKVLGALALSLFFILPGFQVHAFSPELELVSPLGEKQAGLILNTRVSMRVTGLINRVEVEQVYKNPLDETVDARYLFPLPDESAVFAMEMRVDERVITGEIKEKQQARKVFENAKNAGKKAALVRQQRPNMFISELANLGPGQEVTIRLSYQQRLMFKNGEFSIHFPVTLTPRYHPRVMEVGEPGENPAPNGWLSAKLVQGQVSLSDNEAEKQSQSAALKLDIALDTGLELASIETPGYASDTENPAFGRYRLAVESTQANRDFMLRFRPVAANSPRAAFFREQGTQGDYGLLMLMPPSDAFTGAQRQPREVMLVIDTSGSMQGRSLEEAKQALFFALSRLHPDDSFNIVGFASDINVFSGQAVAANDFNLRRARRFVYGLSADGGTEIAKAMDYALDGQTHSGFVRQLIFLTDGSVSNERQVFEKIRDKLGDTRLFTVALGGAPNTYFMRRAAVIGQGSYIQIADASELQRKMKELFGGLENPVLSHIRVENDKGEALEIDRSQLKDVYAGEPLYLALKLPKDSTGLVVRARSVNGPLSWHLNASDGDKGPAKEDAVARLWARLKIGDLLLWHKASEVRDEVLELALKHQLLSPFTAFVAIDNMPAGDRATKQLQVANQAPDGTIISAFPQTDTGSRLAFLLGIALLGLSVYIRKPRYG